MLQLCFLHKKLYLDNLIRKIQQLLRCQSSIISNECMINNIIDFLTKNTTLSKLYQEVIKTYII